MPIAMQVLKRVLLPIAALLAFMIGLGVLLTREATHLWPLTVEDSANRYLAGHRTETVSDVSHLVSGIADTPRIIGVTAVAALVLALTLRRVREPLFLCLAVTAQALVFYFTTVAIDRPRPDVPRMDESPPTSSFPSGHTSAAVALYLGLAVLLAMLVRRTWLKALCWALVLIPAGVALARMYRGMHHPSDVVAAFVNGGVCVYVMSRAFLDRHVPWRRPSAEAGGATRLALRPGAAAR
ncbi:phosphatase PAP2 family protein [Actinoplanes sp. NPDC049802]|uniref:phosphatase PAP2 family protein n=1 Tax=Actinoplanes sp. NPDC049802 TaxID=3154742 RepID=UPI0033C849D2